MVVKPALIAVLNSEQYCKKENESIKIAYIMSLD